MLLFAVAGMAQSTRLVRGFVQKEDGRPVVGATITVVDEDVTGTSAVGGAFELRVSPYARYVDVAYEGFRSVRLEIDGSLLIARLKVDTKYVKAKAEEEARLAEAAKAAETAAAEVPEEVAEPKAKVATEKSSPTKSAEKSKSTEKQKPSEADAARIAAEKEAAEKAAAVEAARIAAAKEAAAKAKAEEAARVAAEKEAAAKAKAEEKARLAAEKQKAAEAEAARIAAEKEAAEKAAAEEAARIAAEKEAAAKAKAEAQARAIAEKEAAAKAKAEAAAQAAAQKEAAAKAKKMEKLNKCVASNVANGKSLAIETPTATYTELGLNYYYGDGMAFDVEKAFLCFNLGAQKNEPESFYWIATYYETGRSFNNLYVEANHSMALLFYERAAELGVAEAVKSVERLQGK